MCQNNTQQQNAIYGHIIPAEEFIRQSRGFYLRFLRTYNIVFIVPYVDDILIVTVESSENVADNLSRNFNPENVD